MSEPLPTTRHWLGQNGEFASHVPGFAVREAQLQMAAEVERTLEQHDTLIVEAGTGTGKTFAYLVPALMSGRKVIVSTGTRNLQDQLFHRDLPVVLKTLGINVRTALLKGRTNYLCRHRLDRTLADGRLQRQHMQDLQEVRKWAGRTRRGDIAELVSVAENSPLWGMVTSNAENCLGKECDSYSNCHVLQARRSAQEAELVVVNHHLFLADMALREEGFGEVLPGTDAYIMDEAHQLPEIASSFFGLTLSSRQMADLVRDVRLEHIQEAGDMQGLPDSADVLDKAVRDVRLRFGQGQTRLSWPDERDTQGHVSAIEGLLEPLSQLNQWLEIAAPRARGLENAWRRCSAMLERLEILTGEADEDAIQWIEVHRRSFSLNRTPLDISKPFSEYMQAQKTAWVFTSATLAVSGHFDHFSGRLGITDAHTVVHDSPFDYQNNALLYMPSAMPEPSQPEYSHRVIALAEQLINTSKGRIFLLFTSHRALKLAAEKLHGQLDYPVLVQGEMPRGELLNRFSELGNAVLLGTSSFWEGVDVRGSALSCVLIDKLPFASPGDPVLQARIDRIRAAKGNPFTSLQLPQAVLALKQGVGRLIRDVSDRGVLVLCDPRLTSKSYGRLFLNSLPSMPVTRHFEDVQQFFANEAQTDEITGD